MTNNSENLLKLKNLRTIFRTSEDPVIAVNDVSININKGEIVGIVGESGCGKSVTALSIMRLVPNPPGEIVSGEILLEGNNLLSVNESEMEKINNLTIPMLPHLSKIIEEIVRKINKIFVLILKLLEANMLGIIKNIEKGLIVPPVK